MRAENDLDISGAERKVTKEAEPEVRSLARKPERGYLRQVRSVIRLARVISDAHADC